MHEYTCNVFGFGDFDQSGECVYLEIIHDEYRHETITKTTSQYIQIVVRITYPKHTSISQNEKDGAI